LTNVVWRLRGAELTAGSATAAVTIPREHTAEQPVKFAFTVLPAAFATGTASQLR
jgi:hypothetical protein